MTTSCEFEFGFWDVTAREDAAFLVSSNQPFAHIEDMNTENGAEFPDVVTLEPGFGWPLDGSKVWFPSDSSAYTWGWWSEELSGEDGGFSNPPKLITTFTENHSSAGVTLRFYATLPKTVNIKWYDLSGRLLADEDFSPDSMLYFCDCLVENYGVVPKDAMPEGSHHHPCHERRPAVPPLHLHSVWRSGDPGRDPGGKGDAV